MKMEEILYFSPNFKYIDLNWDDRDNLIRAFRDRVEGYYLEPAKCLNQCKYSFAAGAICLITIDFLARIETGLDSVGERFKVWVKRYIKDLNDEDISLNDFASRLYEEFRNGLVHEGRIKKASQFSDNFNKLVEIEGLIMIINPKYLLKEIIRSFKEYISKLKTEKSKFDMFKKNLNKDFQNDRDYIDIQ